MSREEEKTWEKEDEDEDQMTETVIVNTKLQFIPCYFFRILLSCRHFIDAFVFFPCYYMFV